jgi:hypothetical protein
MIALRHLRRLALVLALLPQLFVLVLGSGVVLCIAPGGHVQVEVVATECCGESGSTTAGGVERAVSQSDDGCGACSDLQLVLDPRVPRVAGTGAVAGAAALSAEPAPWRSAACAMRVAPRADRGREPPHLIRLRSVLLRC